MGFKLGTERGNYAVSGEIRNKMRFHQEAGGDASVPGTPVIRKNLEPGSYEDRQVINHEMRHATDMRIGKLAYTDDSISYNGEEFPRMDIDGVDSILVDGKWKEAGDTGFPWENDANNGTDGDI